MNRTLRHVLLFVLVGLSGSAMAQEILGTVLEGKEPLINASVRVMQGGILRAGTVTDYDGKYSAKPLDPGLYDVTVSYAGKKTQTITGVVVAPGQKTGLNFTLKADVEGTTLKTAVVTAYKKPLIDPYKNNVILTAAEIKTKPTTSTTDLVALSPGIYQSKRGADVSSDGGRTSGNVYIIDGVQVQGSAGINMAQGSTAQLEVIASGIPANYGDVSGAVINITSTGVSPKLGGSVRAQTSLDGYNNNLLSLSVGGPIIRKHPKDSTKPKEGLMGFSLSADYYNDHNRNPTYNNEYVAKGDVLANLQKNPLKIVSDNSGQPVYNYASNYVTLDQLTRVKQPPHNVTRELRFNGKLDYKLSDNMYLAAGGNFGYTKADQYSRSRNLFAPEATPIRHDYNGRGYIHFRQKFGKQGGGTDTSKHNIISNAYYDVQVDYQNTSFIVEDEKFKKDIFNYGYIGKFTKGFKDFYSPNTLDSVTGRQATTLFVTAPTGISFTRSELNPVMANYTSQYYRSLNDNLPFTINQLQSKNALANGDEPSATYGLFTSPGSTQTYYQHQNSNQYALTVSAGFDLKAAGITHNIEFGLYYQQRIIKYFVAQENLGGTQSLWQQMRQLVSSVDNGNLKLDKTNPITRVNGVNYTYNPSNNTYLDPSGNVANILPSPHDTIFYNYKNVAPTPFDINLRKKLGKGATENINIDELDPSTFSLSMFSADELLNSGKSFVNYYGYTYDGKNQSGTVNFNDFWTAKDANGNYTRPIGAFSPNYIAGYLLDKFEVKNILFNIGLRVERYSANTKVLKDPYSLYGTKTISQAGDIAGKNPNGHHPTNLSGDAVVYVDDNNSSSAKVIGYREGNNWYDAAGNAIANPATLKLESGGRDPQPLLSDPKKLKITDTGFNPNLSFTDYNPQVTLQPRIQISFPISEFSKFSAHYDIYVQRPYPSSIGNATAYDYYTLTSNSSSIISNANLRSQKTYDYELGFDQVIGRKAVLKINGFYKERKDMITVTPYLYAYPTTYYTYGNRDFSTTKGLKAYYEMRATNNLSMSIAYTLTFAEGTGSSFNSNNGGSSAQVQPQGLLQSFIEAGLPNLRFVLPLDVDSRHQLVANLDYRYNENEGPVVKGKHIFQNAGVNFIARTRSGEPWTRLVAATGNTILGSIGGNRLPWHFGVDMRINKDFAFTFGKNAKDAPVGVKAKKVQKLSAFIYFQNLLNTREILSVYGYTGRADDNGYLSSSFGRQAIPVQVNPQSYTDLYKISNNSSDPGKLNYARTINFGLEYNF